MLPKSINKKYLLVALLELVLLIVYGWLFHWSYISNNLSDTSVRIVYNQESLLPVNSRHKTRPGVNTVAISGPRIRSTSKNFFLLPFITTSVTKDVRILDDTGVVSLIVNKTVQPTDILIVKFLANDTWMFAGYTDAGKQKDIAATYTEKGWKVIYNSENGVDEGFDVAAIPQDILSLVGDSITRNGLVSGGIE